MITWLVAKSSSNTSTILLDMHPCHKMEFLLFWQSQFYGIHKNHEICGTYGLEKVALWLY